MWGTDLTSVMTGEGQAAVLVAVDHCSRECVGIHAGRRATRFEALEPVRQGVRQRFGGFDRQIAAGLAVRHDHGSQYVAHDFQNELAFLGLEWTCPLGVEGSLTNPSTPGGQDGREANPAAVHG